MSTSVLLQTSPSLLILKRNSDCPCLRDMPMSCVYPPHIPVFCRRRGAQGRRLAPRTEADGFRFEIIKVGDSIRFYSRHGTKYTDRLPTTMVREAGAVALVPLAFLR